MSIAEDVAAVLSGEKRFVSICARVEEVETLLPDGCANLMPIDGPYHGVKPHAWDNEHDDERAFLAWKRERYAAWKRILAPNGTLYDFASPRMGARVELACRESFNVLTNIRWNKRNNNRGASSRVCKEQLRAPFPDSETIILAEQYGSDSIALGESQYGAECDKLRGFIFEPLRAYLDGERKRSGLSRSEIDEVWRSLRGGKGGMSSHWFGTVQWALPTAENYAWLRSVLNRDGDEFLRTQYEELRTQYEELRRPFAVTPGDQYTDVWNYATVSHRKGKHPCEKPAQLAQDIVRISSRPNDLVLVFFSGSGVFAAEALKQGRRVIAVDADPHWTERTEQVCAKACEVNDGHI